MGAAAGRSADAAAKVNNASAAAVIVAWSTCKKRCEKQAELDAEHEVRDEPKRLPVGDRQAMRVAFEAKFWKLEDSLCPGRSYLEKKLESVEKNDLRAETLSEVVCARDEADGALRPVWDSQMNLKAIRVGPQVPLPSNPEQLRRALNIMGSAWYFVGSIHTTRPYLAEMEMHVWTEYCDYLLGSYVLGMLGNELGGPVNADDWAVILNYEQEIRREMVNQMLGGSPLAKALRAAWQNPLVKDRFFVTALQARSFRGRRDSDGPERKKPKFDQENLKGKIKGKGKGKYKGKLSFRELSGCAEVTPNGKRICYPFNKRGEGCRRVKCNFAHVCGTCFAEGVPMFECRHGVAASSKA